MKVAISSMGPSLDSELDPRFGRACCFVLFDTESHTHKVLDNKASSASGGAGIASAQAVIDAGAQAVITGQLGPNALNVLSAAGLACYHGLPGTIQENISHLNLGKLNRITLSGPSHHGMGGHGHHGGQS